MNDDEVVAVIERYLLADNPWQPQLIEAPPLTRGQRIRGRLLGYRWRIELAVEALRGRHECE